MSKKRKLLDGLVKGTKMAGEYGWKYSKHLESQELKRMDIQKRKRRKDPYEGLY